MVKTYMYLATEEKCVYAFFFLLETSPVYRDLLFITLPDTYMKQLDTVLCVTFYYWLW